jgi:hypothetical protein
VAFCFLTLTVPEFALWAMQDITVRVSQIKHKVVAMDFHAFESKWSECHDDF